MDVSIIGNGFDLRHGFPTTINQFLDDDRVKNKTHNLIICFYKKRKNIVGWVDFENDLLLFFEYIEKLRKSVKFLAPKSSDYKIIRSEFIDSYDAKIFYDVIHSSSVIKGIKKSGFDIIILEDDWESQLTKATVQHYNEFKKLLKSYLLEIEENTNHKSKILETNEISIINKSEKIFTFNYTNTLDRYVDKSKIHYVHGSLNNEIILGVPFSNKVNIEGLQDIFKITQSAKLRLNKSIIDNKVNRVDLHFIGFSFGISDHYFFQELKDWINNVNIKDLSRIPHIHFNLYYHSDSSLNGMLNNLRQFLGEEMFTRFDLQNRIKFIKYEEPKFVNVMKSSL